MSRGLVLRHAARLEFSDAAAWYEDQRAGLGVAFVSEVQLTLDTISEHPLQYRIVDGDVRAAVLSRFPYCIYFRLKPDRVVVIAVFHTSKDPSSWRTRM